MLPVFLVFMMPLQCLIDIDICNVTTSNYHTDSTMGETQYSPLCNDSTTCHHPIFNVKGKRGECRREPGFGRLKDSK